MDISGNMICSVLTESVTHGSTQLLLELTNYHLSTSSFVPTLPTLLDLTFSWETCSNNNAPTLIGMFYSAVHSSFLKWYTFHLHSLIKGKLNWRISLLWAQKWNYFDEHKSTHLNIIINHHHDYRYNHYILLLLHFPWHSCIFVFCYYVFICSFLFSLSSLLLLRLLLLLSFSSSSSDSSFPAS